MSERASFAEEKEVRQHERAIDEFFQRVPLPGRSYYEAMWHLVTVAEDFPRLFRLGARSRRDVNRHEQLHRAVLMVDRIKYGLRHAMDRVRSAYQPDALPYRHPRVNETQAMNAVQLLTAGIDYSAAVRAFSSYSYRYYYCEFDQGSGALRFFPRYPQSSSYDAAYMLALAEQPGGSYLTFFLNAVSESEGAFFLSELAKRTVDASHGRITYGFDVGLARELLAHAESICSAASILPRDWNFPWGPADDITGQFKALRLRGLYHLLSIHAGAVARATPGIGAPSLVLIAPDDRLSTEIQILHPTHDSSSERLLDALTYGTDTTSPDPALQPLVRSDQQRRYVLSMQVISSNFERNLLVLHNRVSTASFDAQSWRFEQMMITACETTIVPRYPRSRFNTYLPGFTHEIDIMIADVESQTLLLGEAKWMLEPGDPKEIFLRKNELEKKIAQADRQLDFVNSNLSGVLSHLGVDVDAEALRLWKVASYVIVDGYGGATGEHDPLKLIPWPVFRIGVERARSLRSFTAVFESGEWFPIPSVHYLSDAATVAFGEYQIEWPTLSFPFAISYLDHVKAVFST